MSHHIYTTPGFIVHSSPQGEAGKYFLVFTRDLGMIGATAQGIRLSASKLRYYAQDYARSLFSLVRGKEVWRMIGTKEMEGEMDGEIKDADAHRLYVRILSLLKRLLHGEEKNERLFEVVESFYKYLLVNVLDKEKRELVEYVTVLRILDSLGYVHSKNEMEKFCIGSDLNDEILDEVGLNKKGIIEKINSGLKESQL